MTVLASEDTAYKKRPSTKARSPFRYPGGKGFLTDFLRQKILKMPSAQRAYAEPFCGGAGAAINLLLDGDVERIQLNDLDRGIYSAWVAIVTETDRFIDKLKSIQVTVPEWKLQKQIAITEGVGYNFDVGFASFFINRTSRAGIVLGSGPIGGYEQLGLWKIDARFYRETMVRRITEIGAKRDQIAVSNQSAVTFIRQIDQCEFPGDTFVFIDPPYYEIGSRLYLDSMGNGGHNELATELKTGALKHWLMTYDDHPEIRKLYRGFNITELEVLYSLQRQRTVNEIVIQATAS